MEFTNALHDYAKDRSVDDWGPEAREFVLDWSRLLGPLAPHLGEELWAALGGAGSLFDESWPEWEEKALQRDIVNLVLQVNGKVREQMEAPRGADRSELEQQALVYGRIPEWIDGKEIRKVIVVPDKLVNIVVG